MQCQFIKQNQQLCEANAMAQSEYCFSHNPATKEAHEKAVSKGGKALAKNNVRLPPVNITTSRDVVKLLTATINEVRAGMIDIRVANCIGYLSGPLIRAFEITNIEARINEIEKLVLQKT